MYTNTPVVLISFELMVILLYSSIEISSLDSTLLSEVFCLEWGRFAFPSSSCYENINDINMNHFEHVSKTA